MSTIGLWVLVLFETVLLVLLLRALGQLRQQGVLSTRGGQSPDNAGLAVGEQAVPFSLTDDRSAAVQLTDFKGQRCLLAFILPGCPACKNVIQVLNTLLEEEPAMAVVVIGGEDSERNRAYAAEHDAHMPIFTLPPGLDKRYLVQGVPFIFVLDGAGSIRAKGVVNERQHLQDLLSTAFEPVPVSR